MAADKVGGFGNLIGIVAGIVVGKFTLSLVLAMLETGS